MDFPFVHLAFEGADAVDEKDAVEVVDFMLDANRQQVVGFEFDVVAVPIHAANDDVARALDLGIDARDRETAFLPGDFAGAASVLKEKQALAAVCGRVCPQEEQCEKMCVVGKKNEPLE